MAKTAGALDQLTKGNWTWNEATNTLEYSNPNADRAGMGKGKDKRGAQQRGGAGLYGHFQDMHGGILKKTDQRGGTPGSRAFGQGRQLGTGAGHRSPNRQSGKQTGDHTHVTLQDVKSVALNMLAEVNMVSSSFVDGMFRTEQFDEFLMYLLNFFHWFFEKRAQDTKPNPMNIEPSRAEMEYYAQLCTKLEGAQKQLGRSYCVLVLGVGLQNEHHMACGQSRVSSTYKDRSMYETMYSFLTFLVWIAFKRKEYEIVKKEIGRILRSDTFNPAIRVKNAPEGETSESGKDGDKKSSKSEKKLTPAEYRRLHGKRPPIKSIINQRSPALVSIMPAPKEEANWLFKRSGALSPTALGSVAKEDDNESPDKYEHLHTDLTKLKVGIIGEPRNQFNHITLTPIGADNEEEEEGDRSETSGDKSKTSHRESLGPEAPALSRQQTAISSATTGGNLSDDE